MVKVSLEEKIMKVQVLKKTSNELKIEIEDEGHSLCNVLQKVLIEDDTVDMAGYTVPHPLLSHAIVYVRTKKRRKPEDAIKDAVKKIRAQNKEFRTSFERSLKSYNSD
jgi:DNA-directed RNA polymerase subunit L